MTKARLRWCIFISFIYAAICVWKFCRFVYFSSFITNLLHSAWICFPVVSTAGLRCLWERKPMASCPFSFAGSLICLTFPKKTWASCFGILCLRKNVEFQCQLVIPKWCPCRLNLNGSIGLNSKMWTKFQLSHGVFWFEDRMTKQQTRGIPCVFHTHIPLKFYAYFRAWMILSRLVQFLCAWPGEFTSFICANRTLQLAVWRSEAQPPF